MYSHLTHMVFWSMMDGIYDGGPIDSKGAKKFVLPSDTVAS